MDAIVAANFTSGDSTERTVLVPSNFTFHMMPIWADNWTDVTITIDGTILASKRHHKYPLKDDRVRMFMEFNEVQNLTINGSGSIDGQGYMWWVRELIQ